MTDESLRGLERAARASPDDVQACNRLAAEYARTGRLSITNDQDGYTIHNLPHLERTITVTWSKAVLGHATHDELLTQTQGGTLSRLWSRVRRPPNQWEIPDLRITISSMRAIGELLNSLIALNAVALRNHLLAQMADPGTNAHLRFFITSTAVEYAEFSPTHVLHRIGTAHQETLLIPSLHRGAYTRDGEPDVYSPNPPQPPTTLLALFGMSRAVDIANTVGAFTGRTLISFGYQLPSVGRNLPKIKNVPVNIAINGWSADVLLLNFDANTMGKTIPVKYR